MAANGRTLLPSSKDDDEENPSQPSGKPPPPPPAKAAAAAAATTPSPSPAVRKATAAAPATAAAASRDESNATTTTTTNNKGGATNNGGAGGRRRLLLYTPGDETQLSDLICLSRKQLEVFAATRQDISARACRGGRTQQFDVGRVGFRCIHCADLPMESRARGAVSYPLSIRIMYQGVRNWQRYHFAKCQAMPEGVKELYRRYKDHREYSSKTCRAYWIETCRSLGLVDHPDAERGIVFRSGGGPGPGPGGGAVVASAAAVGAAGRTVGPPIGAVDMAKLAAVAGIHLGRPQQQHRRQGLHGTGLAASAAVGGGRTSPRGPSCDDEGRPRGSVYSAAAAAAAAAGGRRFAHC